MVNLSAEAADLWRALGAAPPGRSRIVQVVAARDGEGASTVARELAHHVAHRAGRSVWLVDLDLLGGAQAGTLAEAAGRYGDPGDPVAASPDGTAFYTVRPPAEGPEAWPDARYLVANRVGEAKFWVTRFRREALAQGQTVHVLGDPAYWNALRRHADVIIVDCPPLSRSRSALTVAPHMDQTVVVVAADQPDLKAPAALRDALTEAGARVEGLFFNRMTAQPPGFLRALGL